MKISLVSYVFVVQFAASVVRTGYAAEQQSLKPSGKLRTNA